jgi:hypothetical protein
VKHALKISSGLEMLPSTLLKKVLINFNSENIKLIFYLLKSLSDNKYKDEKHSFMSRLKISQNNFIKDII